jgi:hypothetical protein
MAGRRDLSGKRVNTAKETYLLEDWSRVSGVAQLWSSWRRARDPRVEPCHRFDVWSTEGTGETQSSIIPGSP